jgi:hypothetical protein
MTMIRNITMLAGAFMGLLTLASEVSAAPALGDYDADGYSDLAVAQVDRKNRVTDFLVRSTQSGVGQNHRFNVPADALVSGKYFADGRTYPGVVWVRDAELPLEWYIKNPAEQDVFVRFGLPGDMIPNQGDLDCDGITDFTVVRNGTGARQGYLMWYVALSSQGGAVAEVLFGLKNDRVAIADLDGDGCGEQVALRDGFLWFGKKLFGVEVSQIQWGLPGDIPLLPQDIDSDGQPDYLISRITGAGQQIYARLSSRQPEIYAAGQDTSVPMVGNFIGANSFAWMQRDTGFTALMLANRLPFVFLFGTATNALIRPDGTVVQPNDSARFGAVATNPTTPGNSACDETRRNKDGSGKFKWNAENSRHTSKVMPTSDLTGNIADIGYYRSDRTLFDDLDFGGYEYGNRERWYGSKSLSSYPDDGYVLVQLKNGRTVCWDIPDPQRNWD